MDHSLFQQTVLPLGVGMIFGTAFQLGHIQEFYFIRNQMDFSTAVMLKMFLGAAATSLFIFFAIRKISAKENQDKLERMSGWATHTPYRGILSGMLGAFLIGIGMFLSGSCPGTVYTQLGGGSKKAMATWVGGLLGTFIFGLADAHYKPTMTRVVSSGMLARKNTLPHVLGLSHDLTSVLMLLFLVGVLVFCEIFYPWKEELIKMYETFGVTDYDRSFKYEIAPTFAGMIIGALQVPLFFLMHVTLGCATSYATIIANIFPFWTSSDHINGARTYYWQLSMVIGISLGSYIFCSETGHWFVSDDMVSYNEALFGGIIFSFGSRLSGGCTSGHGISGFSYLSLVSLLATASMFGGAIFTGLIYNAVN